MGSGYLAGAYFFYRVLRASAWHTFGIAFLPITVFATLMAVTTLLHLDRFHHGHVVFWAWASVYALTPFLVPFVWWRNRAHAPAPVPGEARLDARVRWAFAMVGAAELVAVVAVFADPHLLIDVWPWTLSPLTARVMASWFALTATLWILVARDGRWGAIKIIIQASVIGLLLILVSTGRAWTDFDPSNPLRWAFVAGMAALLVGFSALLTVMDRTRPSRGSA